MQGQKKKTTIGFEIFWKLNKKKRELLWYARAVLRLFLPVDREREM